MSFLLHWKLCFYDGEQTSGIFAICTAKSLASKHPVTLNLTLKPSVLLTSQNGTPPLPLIVPLFSIKGQSSFSSLSENVLHVLLILRRTLEVELSIHLLSGLLTLQTKQGELNSTAL